MKSILWKISKDNTKLELIKKLINHVECSQYYEEKTFTYHVCEQFEEGITVVWSVMDFNVLQDYRDILQKGRHYYIRCTVIKNENGKWHYSTCSEFSFPIHLNCPLEFLALATYEVNHEWRKQVRIYHQNNKQ